MVKSSFFRYAGGDSYRKSDHREADGGHHSLSVWAAKPIDNCEGADNAFDMKRMFHSGTGRFGANAKNPAVYRCPGDRSGRVRSMAMNAYLNGFGVWQDAGYVTFRKLADLRNPSQTWVLIDEREDSINDGYFAVDMRSHYSLLDYPASYHEGAGTPTFADGHAESHRWVEASAKPPLQPGEHLSLNPAFTAPKDRDLKWLTERTTLPKQ